MSQRNCKEVGEGGSAGGKGGRVQGDAEVQPNTKIKPNCDDGSMLYKYARSHLFIYLKWVNSVGCKW